MLNVQEALEAFLESLVRLGMDLNSRPKLNLQSVLSDDGYITYRSASKTLLHKLDSLTTSTSTGDPFDPLI